MDFLAPAIAIVIGAAILAPGVIRFLKKQNNTTDGCGGCSGCGNSDTKQIAAPQIVKLQRK